MRFDIEERREKKEKKEYEDKQKMYRILIFFFVIGVVLLLFIYIVSKSGNKTTSTTTPTTPPTTVTPPQTIEKEQPKLSIYNEDSNERPIAVMIDNAIGDAKHAGLQDSYLNYEILVEGGLTRIMAVYKDSDVPLIGPIRSSRHYFLDYVLENDAIYVHYGWSPYAQEDQENLDIASINGLTNQTPFRRDTNSIPPHNVFTKMSYIRSYLDQTNYSQESDNWQLLNYNAEGVDLTTDTAYVPKEAIKINIPYSANEYRTYTYDSSKKYYLRSTNGKAHIDRRTNKQLHYKNIIIQRADYKIIDNENRIDVKTVGSGKGYFITNGYFIPIKWSKSSRKAKTIYTYDDGSEIVLNDGNTFIQIVPSKSNITIE